MTFDDVERGFYHYWWGDQARRGLPSEIGVYWADDGFKES
jgi:hypothetical protein